MYNDDATQPHSTPLTPPRKSGFWGWFGRQRLAARIMLIIGVFLLSTCACCSAITAWGSTLPPVILSSAKDAPTKQPTKAIAQAVTTPTQAKPTAIPSPTPTKKPSPTPTATSTPAPTPSPTATPKPKPSPTPIPRPGPSRATIDKIMYNLNFGSEEPAVESYNQAKAELVVKDHIGSAVVPTQSLIKKIIHDIQKEFWTNNIYLASVSVHILWYDHSGDLAREKMTNQVATHLINWTWVGDDEVWDKSPEKWMKSGLDKDY